MTKFEEPDEPAYEPFDPERPATATPTESDLDQQLPVSSHLAKRDPYAAWRFRDYTLYSLGGFVSGLGGQLQSVTIGYDMARRAEDARQASLILGLVALVQALPVILLALPSGHLADRYNRRKIMLAGLLATALGACMLAYLSSHQASLPLIYGCLLFIATAQALKGPAQQAFFPQLVPPQVLANAVTWNSTRGQIASVIGPALFGPVLLLFGEPAWVYVLDAILMLIFFGFILVVRGRPQQRSSESISVASLLAGAKFVWRSQLILATLTLDLFAVLLGGAVILLPVYAEHILNVGPSGLGWMRAAPAAGAVCMAVTLAFLPPLRRAGKTLLWAVAGFGLATIVFGLSRNLWLSLLALFLTGACDNISVMIRHTLVQLLTPDAMRGRVSAVNSVFIGASNELGGFESGITARFFGVVTSVVAGGVGTILVVLGTDRLFPQVRRLKSLETLTADEMSEVSSSSPAEK